MNTAFTSLRLPRFTLSTFFVAGLHTPYLRDHGATLLYPSMTTLRWLWMPGFPWGAGVA